MYAWTGTAPFAHDGEPLVIVIDWAWFTGVLEGERHSHGALASKSERFVSEHQNASPLPLSAADVDLSAAGTAPRIMAMVHRNELQAWNLPFGVISHLYRDVAARRPGPVTRIGLCTFMDPREAGGKLNTATTRDVVQLMRIDGQEFLWCASVSAGVDLCLVRESSA
jgi:hypothetical protein